MSQVRSPLVRLPQLVFPRLKRALGRLAGGVWGDRVELEVERTESVSGDFGLADALGSPMVRVEVPGIWQAGGYSTTWHRVRLPDGYRLRPGDHFCWDDNAEATAWTAGGDVLFGLDATHRHWPWPKGERELWIESSFCQSGIWHASAKGIGIYGSELREASVVRKDEDAWQAYFDLEVLVDWLEEEIRRAMPLDAELMVGGFRTWPEIDRAGTAFLPDGVGTGMANRFRPGVDRLPELVRRMMGELDDAVTVYFATGVGALRDRLKPIYGLLREAYEPVRATMTGHAHIDLVWLWPERVGEQKAVRTFATTERLLREYPEFHFGYSQPTSYFAVGKRAPKLMQRVKRQIRDGRWEATGALLVESDTLLPCGEALLRSFELGQRGFRKLTGAASRVLWLPDAFGFSGCLPRLMQMTGVRGFFTNKLMWNAIHRFPHSSFVWRGHGGAEVLAHVSRACGYNNPGRPKNLRAELDAHRQSDVHREFLLPSGWGDGGGGPTADIIERVRRQGNLRNQPSGQWGRIDDFYERMEGVRDALPVHSGEMLLEAHRGTYTTQAATKEAYRNLECALRAWEAAHCVAGKGPIPDRFWERLAFAQFHDLLPGSSVHEVYEEALVELANLAKEAESEAVQALTESGLSLTRWFNPLPLPVRVSVDGLDRILRPLGCDVEAVSGGDVQLLPFGISNDWVVATFSDREGLQQLTVDGRGLLTGGVRLVSYVDIPHDLEAWEIDRQALDAGEVLKPAGKVELCRDGGSGISTQTWITQGGSTVRLVWRLRPGSRTLEAACEVDWREPERLLRLEVGTPYRGRSALFGAPFGGEWRCQDGGSSEGAAFFEVPASRWAMVSDEGRQEGVFLITEAKYGFSAHGGTLGVSLVKSAKVTVTTAFPATFREAGPDRPAFSDLGMHQIRLALGRFGWELPRDEFPAALAESLFAKPLRVSGDRAMEFPKLTGLASVVPVWAVPLGRRRWVLRLHETMGARGRIEVEMPEGWKVRPVPDAGHPDPEPQSGRGAFSVEPFDILSLEFWL